MNMGLRATTIRAMWLRLREMGSLRDDKVTFRTIPSADCAPHRRGAPSASRAGLEFAGGKGPRENQKSHQAPNPINGQLAATACLANRTYVAENPHQFRTLPRRPQPVRKAVFSEEQANTTRAQSQKRTVRLNGVMRQFAAGDNAVFRTTSWGNAEMKPLRQRLGARPRVDLLQAPHSDRVAPARGNRFGCRLRSAHVTIDQMVGALVRAVENPPQGVRIVGVPEIRGESISGS